MKTSVRKGRERSLIMAQAGAEEISEKAQRFSRPIDAIPKFSHPKHFFQKILAPQHIIDYQNIPGW